jgi:hypothetical protein
MLFCLQKAKAFFRKNLMLLTQYRIFILLIFNSFILSPFHLKKIHPHFLFISSINAYISNCKSTNKQLSPKPCQKINVIGTEVTVLSIDQDDYIL